MLSNLEVLLWRTVAHCANRRLRKIRIVHSALIRRCDIVKLGAGMRKRLEHERQMRLWANRTVNEEGAWRVEEDVEEGRCRSVKGGGEEQVGREVVLLFGETIRGDYPGGRNVQRCRRSCCRTLPTRLASAVVHKDPRPSARLGPYRRRSGAFGILIPKLE